MKKDISITKSVKPSPKKSPKKRYQDPAVLLVETKAAAAKEELEIKAEMLEKKLLTDEKSVS